MGLSFSAMSWASASPEPLSDMLTLVPVVREYTVAIMLHQSACTEQMMLTCPWAAAPMEAARVAANKMVFFMVGSCGCRLSLSLAAAPQLA